MIVLHGMPRPTTKCDVFSYGIVVVEVITKTMPTTENRHELFGEVERKWRLMYDLVSRCAEVSPHARPTMADILNPLNRIPMPGYRPR
jgi:serine/threonine protein kinase